MAKRTKLTQEPEQIPETNQENTAAMETADEKEEAMETQPQEDFVPEAASEEAVVSAEAVETVVSDKAAPLEEPPEAGETLEDFVSVTDMPSLLVESPEPEQTDTAGLDSVPESDAEPLAAVMQDEDFGEIAVPDIPPVPEEEKKSNAPQKKNTDFYALDVRELDRDLSPEQREEWNSIYASFRSHSLLRGKVAGVEETAFQVRDRQTGMVERKKVFSLVLIGYRVKILIPMTEVWMPGEERPDHVARSMIGAEIDYVVQNIDREGECAVASRRLALPKLRRLFASVRGGHPVGELLECSVLAVGAKRLLASCGGYDITLSQRELSWTAIPDLREKYRPGEVLRAKLLSYTPAEENKLTLSVRDVNPNPFDGAERRHPIGCRRQAVVSGKYKGGVFCRLPDGAECLCTYSNMLSDSEFMQDDTVLVYISRFDYSRKQIFGRIVTKL